MDRYDRRLRPRRDSGLPNKHDTPPKKIVSRRDGKRRLLNPRRYETLHEVPEEKDTDKSPVVQKHQVQEVAISAVGESKSRPVTPASSDNLRNKLSTTPKNQRPNLRTPQANFRVSPIQRVLKSSLILGEEDGNVCESVTSPSVEPDTSFSRSDEDEDRTFSSSFASPEIFRTDSDATPVTYPIAEPHLHNKNSTLLDVSHARSIHMHLSPDLSTIIDASIIPPDKKCELIYGREPGPENETQADSSVQALEKNSTPKFFKKRPIVFKKKVWFKSPIISETFKVKDVPADTTVTVPNSNDSSKTTSPNEKLRFDADASGADEISSEEETLPLKVALRRPVKSSAAEKVKFFDFADDEDKYEFFRKMRERHERLTTMVFYPSVSANEQGLVSGCQL
ncbi:uncharacterized protein LOC114475928 [Gouania willdenowi]|uniref:uncharacterized protein LOC114475928 n=1 Tax=Gouania willdenowi TaxID=441366 RepID=UPI001054BB48|nr:uncharacterized protein LOC114475928 [Gouania willdenowi]